MCSTQRNRRLIAAEKVTLVLGGFVGQSSYFRFINTERKTILVNNIRGNNYIYHSKGSN